jgi:hypothetical protein
MAGAYSRRAAGLNRRLPGDDVPVLLTRLARVVAAAGLLGLAAPAGADAKVFRGETAQGRAASVVVGSDALVRRARVNWRAPCRRGRYVDRTDFEPPLDVSTPDSIADEGVYRTRSPGGIRARVTVGLRGRRTFDAAHPRRESWRGTLRVQVLVTRNGRYLDTCGVRTLRWHVRLVA